MATAARKPAVLVDDLIRWYDHNYFRGYVFATKRRGHRHVKYFSAKPDGPTKALARARRYRDAMLIILEPPTRVKRRYAMHPTGVIGVSLTRERTRQGRWLQRYVASFPAKGGKKGKTSFSIAKYGRQPAFRLAVAARKKGVADFESSVSYRDYQKRSRPKGSKA